MAERLTRRALEVTDEARGLSCFLRTPHLPDVDVVRLGMRTALLADGQLQPHVDWGRILGLLCTAVNATFEIVELAQSAELPA